MKNLKALRTARGLTQAELAKKVGTKTINITRYENCQREADYATLIKVADILNTTTDYLIGRESAAPPPPNDADSELRERLRRLSPKLREELDAILELASTKAE